MKHAPVLLVLAAGGLFGWFAPDLSQEKPEPAPATTQEPAADTKVESLQKTGWSAGEVVLAREPDGHFYADVEVGGSSARMLVDTGASVIALTDSDADRLGIRWSRNEISPVAKGASGTVYGVRTRLARVRVGDIEARHVDAVIVPEGLAISLLGQSFLAEVGRVEMDQDRMTLGS